MSESEKDYNAKRMEFQDRYTRAAQQLQTAVKLYSNYDSTDMGPIHLRVGINSSLVDSWTIAHLLIKKGIITELEYIEALAVEMEREVDRYKYKFKKYLGRPDMEINFG